MIWGYPYFRKPSYVPNAWQKKTLHVFPLRNAPPPTWSWRSCSMRIPGKAQVVERKAMNVYEHLQDTMAPDAPVPAKYKVNDWSTSLIWGFFSGSLDGVCCDRGWNSYQISQSRIWCIWSDPGLLDYPMRHDHLVYLVLGGAVGILVGVGFSAWETI